MATDKTAATATAPLNQSSTIPSAKKLDIGKGKPHVEESETQKRARKAGIKARRERYSKTEKETPRVS